MCKKFARRYLQGRIVNVPEWENRIRKVCLKWLNKTPVVSKTDEKQGVFDNILRKNSKKSIQIWQVGSLYLALKENGIEDFTFKCFTDKIKKEYDLLNIKDSDYGLLIFALIGDDDFKKEILAMLDYINDNQNEYGNIRYKSFINGALFVDTLGFVCPFLIKYGITNNEEKYIQLAKYQIRWYIENGTEKHCGLPFHAVRTDDKTTLGICDWARGTAWLLIALMDGYSSLKNVGRDDDFLKYEILRFADILINLQKESGAYSWQLLTCKDSDSSATAVIGWFFAKSYEYFGKKEYLDCAEKCRNYLMTITFINGVIDYCQGDTLSIGVYSRLFDKMPFGQAFALRLQNVLKSFNKD